MRGELLDKAVFLGRRNKSDDDGKNEQGDDAFGCPTASPPHPEPLAGPVIERCGSEEKDPGRPGLISKPTPEPVSEGLPSVLSPEALLLVWPYRFRSRPRRSSFRQVDCAEYPAM